MLGENEQAIRENTEIFIKECKDIGLKANSQKTKYTVYLATKMQFKIKT